MNKPDFKHLFFALDPSRIPEPDLDLATVQTTIGVRILFGAQSANESDPPQHEIKWAHTYGDLGGDPEGLDATPLSSKVEMQKAGRLSQENWTVDYWLNPDDYRWIEEKKNAEASEPVYVVFDGGAIIFENKGRIVANRHTGASTNAVAEGHVTFELSSAEGWTVAYGAGNG